MHPTPAAGGDWGRPVPDDAAVIRLAGAVLLETHDEWQTADRASEEPMAQLTHLSDNDPGKEVTHDGQHQLPAA